MKALRGSFPVPCPFCETCIPCLSGLGSCGLNLSCFWPHLCWLYLIRKLVFSLLELRQELAMGMTA